MWRANSAARGHLAAVRDRGQERDKDRGRRQGKDVRRNRSSAMVAAIGRRGLLGGAAALSAGLWSPLPGHAASAMDFDEARHLLSRTTFGATLKP